MLCHTSRGRSRCYSSPSACHEQLSLRKHCIGWKGLEVFWLKAERVLRGVADGVSRAGSVLHLFLSLIPI